ncbi:MAG: hypothetical protein GY946_28730 [bacterium]|nr:hypothetical protein [bacterium]
MASNGSSSEAADPPEARLEAALLVLLCAAVLAYWAFQFQPFVVPNNDYASFERIARSFAELEAPSSFKRMPILPALMALTAPAFSGEHPYLVAALGLNQVFSVASLVGLFLIGRKTIGPGALLLPLLFATTTQFHANGLQPLVEPSLGCFVIWAFVLQGRGSSWQYAFAAAAALSRYEAAVLIPVLFLAEWSQGRRIVPPLWKAGLASLPLLLWVGGGALAGSGGSSYYDLMAGMGFQPAPGFFLRSLKEPFAGWYTSQWLWIGPFTGVVILPLLAGVVAGLRERRIETIAMLGFGLVCVTVIVTFGINKARYVYPTEWIWLLLWVWGALRLAEGVVPRLARLGFPFARVAAAAGLAVSGLALAFWLRKMTAGVQTVSLGLELSFLALVIGLAGVAILLALAGVTSRSWRVAAAAGLLVATVPLVAGGMVGKQRAVYKIAYANWSAHLLSDWLANNLRPGEKVALLPRTHVVHLTGLPSRQLLPYSGFEAEDLGGLRSEFENKGVDLAVFTDRGPLRNPSHHHYYRVKKTYLAEIFEGATPVAGFAHLATLTLPEHLDEKDVQIYRFVGVR